VINAVVREGRKPAEVARAYQVSPSWVSKLLARYRAEGEAAFEPRSRRPRSSPTAIADSTATLILELRDKLTAEGHDAGPATITWHLATQHRIVVSPATVARKLTAAGKVTPQPRKKPRSSYLRFEAAQPNEMWQSDFTHYPLATGTDCEIISWLDDCARYALRVEAHGRITGRIVLTSFRTSVQLHGIPASTLTDNGMVYTTRFAGGRGGRSALEVELRRLHIEQKNSQPNHPTTCGKVERFQQTMKNWLRAQPVQPATLAELQALLDRFVDDYNHRRPHRSLPNRSTPAARYTALPKALPTGSRDPDTHNRVRNDRIDDSGVITLRHNGRLHHIGIGRTHARTHVIVLVQDLDIRVVAATTGELLRELTLDPTRDYQPEKPRNP
jgi:transposase InsO family protein